MRTTALAILALLGGTFISLTPKNVTATNFNYTGNSCTILGCAFSNPSNWSPSGGPPGSGDIATIAIGDLVVLTQDTGAINLLSIQNGADVFTGGNQLDVTGGANGFTDIVGSRLVVQNGSFFDFVTDTLSLRQSGNLDMKGGSATAKFVMRVSTSSLVSGHGAVGLTTGSGVGLDLAGTVRPVGGNLTFVATNSLLDLDGNIGGNDANSLLDVTADGDLIINGALHDPFSGRLHMGNSNTVEFSAPFFLDGTLSFISGAHNRLVAPSFTFESGAEITADMGRGKFETNTVFKSGSQAHLVNPSDWLMMYATSTINSGVTFSGNGSIVNAGFGSLTLRDGANIGVRVNNSSQSEMRIGSPVGAATAAEYTQSSAATLEMELGGLVPGIEFDQLTVTGLAALGGTLEISLHNGFSLSPGDSFEILDIGGMRNGEFNGLTEGALVGNFGEDLFITYAGGDGNDVVLFTQVPEPEALLLLLLAAIAIPVRRQ